MLLLAALHLVGMPPMRFLSNLEAMGTLSIKTGTGNLKNLLKNGLGQLIIAQESLLIQETLKLSLYIIQTELFYFLEYEVILVYKENIRQEVVWHQRQMLAILPGLEIFGNLIL